MTSPFDKLASQEVLTIAVAETVVLRFAPITDVREAPKVLEDDPNAIVQLGVIFADHLKGFREETGEPIDRAGIVLKVIEKNNLPVHLFWRMWNARTIGTLRGHIERGDIFRRKYKVTRPGFGVRYDYEVSPLEFTP